MKASTIAAVATPAGAGAIGIVKISGPRALAIAGGIFRFRDGCRPGAAPGERALESHRLHYGYVVEAAGGQVVDEVLLAVMHAPRSYTGEDVVEINAHSGPAVVQEILQLVLGSGARMARPGEFTRRAFLNGRMDLTQAEAVMELIGAENRQAARYAALQLNGDTRKSIQEIREVLIDISAELEAQIDFPGEFEEALPPAAHGQRLVSHLLEPLEKMVQRRRRAGIYLQNPSVAVIGRPNVGKSSLVNRLLGHERVIVTDSPGTTRDVVKERWPLSGLTLRLCDTAGLRDSRHPAERIGIEMTRRCVDEAEMVLLVVACGRPLNQEDRAAAELVGDKPCVLVWNQSDRFPGWDPGAERPAKAHWPAVVISARTGAGIEKLNETVFDLFGQLAQVPGAHAGTATVRQIEALERTQRAARRLVEGLRLGRDAELVAIDLDETRRRLDLVDGREGGEDVLDRIFDTFCIGK